MGPFVDDTDFKTLETALTIANTDVKLSKNGASSVNKNSGGGTHIANGEYSFTFDATDTNTVGELTAIISVAGALVVKKTFFVLSAVVYDAIYGSSPTLLTAKDIGQLYESTVATVTSQTEFIMTDSIVSDGNWIGQTVTIEDASTGEAVVRYVVDVVQSTKTIIINTNCPFTVVATDILRVESRQHPAYALNAYDPPTKTEMDTAENNILSKMRAYTRLLARNDTAVTTDQAVELAAINADDGAGAGDYNNQTDSLEAIDAGVNVTEINGGTVYGAGTSGDKWRGTP